MYAFFSVPVDVTSTVETVNTLGNFNGFSLVIKIVIGATIGLIILRLLFSLFKHK